MLGGCVLCCVVCVWRKEKHKMLSEVKYRKGKKRMAGIKKKKIDFNIDDDSDWIDYGKKKEKNMFE